MNLLFLNKAIYQKLVTCIFVLLSIWWMILFFVFKNTLLSANLVWAASYQIIAILGAVLGLIISKRWGGFKSMFGRSILFFSVGLLFQAFGQSMFSFFNLVLKINIPYPSIADIGFFGSVIFYIYGIILLGRVFGAKDSLKNFLNKILVVLIPITILSISYHFFLKNYDFDWTKPLQIFLDFGYPFGQAIYIAIAISVYILSRKFLGGVLKGGVFFILIALVVQYVAEYNFLYQALNQTWVNGSYGDYIYAVSYFTMTLAIIYIGNIFQKIRFENETVSSLHPEINTPNDKLFNQILVEIIKRQERIAGHLAWEQVRRVENIIVNDEATVNVSINGNPKQTIDQLVYNFKNLFGDIAVDVSKSAVRYLTAELPSDQVPDSLK